MGDPTPEDEEMSSDSSDSDSSLEDESHQEVATLLQQVQSEPYNYDAHVRLISRLRSSGASQALADERENMSRMFPLSPQLWLDWIRDQAAASEEGDAEQRDSALALCERAVRDYVSVDVWLEFCQLALGVLAEEGGAERARAVFERALTAAGLHVTQGALLWEAYREFEAALCAAACAADPDSEAAVSARVRVAALLRRQARLPLQGTDRAWAELEALLAEQGAEPEPHERRQHQQAQEALTKLLPLEQKLAAAEDDEASVGAYQQYIRHELAEGTPARVQCLLERAICRHPLSLPLWQAYTRYLDYELKPDAEITLSVHERAVRNLPWSAELWEAYIRAVERSERPVAEAEELVSRALSAGLQSAADYMLVWLAWLDLFRRRLSRDNTASEQLMEQMRPQFNKACEHLAQLFGLEGDRDCVLLQYWASLEAANGFLPEANGLWNDIMSQGHDKSAHMWLQYLRLVQRFSTGDQLRKLFARALERTVDWPESIYQMWAAYERERGTINTWDEMAYRYRVRMKRVQVMRAKQAEKEEQQQQQEKQRQEAKLEKRKLKDKEWRKNKRQQMKEEGRNESDAGAAPADSPTGQKRKRDDSPEDDRVRPAPSARTQPQQDGGESSQAAEPAFKIPPPPGFKPPPPPGFKPPPPPGFKTPPPPGFKSASSRDRPDPSEADPASQASQGQKRGADGDVERDSRTVFVSNLAYTTDAAAVRSRLKSAGEITDVRLVNDYKGRSKGFAYVEFGSIAAAKTALELDRSPIDGRPCFVSPMRRSGALQQPGFKYSTGLERNKLFVKGLPFSMTAEQLREKFSEFGVVSDVRLVTFRNGHSKGLAYVDFEGEKSAAQALLKTDKTVIEGKTISVAFSDPPRNRASPAGAGGPAPGRDARPAATLGAGGRATAGRGRLQLGFVPRALQKKPEANTNGAALQQPAAAKSNADFRNMLLNKDK